MCTQKSRPTLPWVSTLLAGLVCSVNAYAVDIFWTGETDTDFGTATNWFGSALPVSGAALVFDIAKMTGVSSSIVNNALTTAPVYNALTFNNGGFSITGSQIALQPSSTNLDVIKNLAGSNTISAPLRIDPNAVDRILSTQVLDSARISVNSGSLTLGGAVTAGQVNLTTNLNSAGGSSLSMNDVSAKSFTANWGTQNLLGALNSSTVSLVGTNFTVGGAGGAINAAGGAVSLASGAQLTLDNTTAASNMRLSGNLAMAAGTTFLLKGDATTDVAQNAGVLTVTGSNSALTHIKVEGAGANASMSFNSLSLSGLVNFASSGALGGEEQIKFGTAPTLTNGLMSRALVNGHQFATYNAANGVVAATTSTTLSGAMADDHVYISATESLAGNSAINSLAVNNSVINGSGVITLASGKLLTSGVAGIEQAINFGNVAGEIINMGTTVLAGGVNGSNSLTVLGNGRLEMASAGSLAGVVTHDAGGQLVLSANNALQGASLTSFNLDIGNTTQNLNSFSGAVTGTGRIVAVNSIGLYQNLVDVNLEGGNVSIGSAIVNGNIQSSGSVNLYSSIANGVISGNAKVIVNEAATFTNQNTYAGVTATVSAYSGTGVLTLSGNGSIAASSGFSGSLTMRAADGDNGALDRVGNSAAVSLAGGGVLSMQSAGSVVMSEDIGVINVSGAARLEMANGAGSATLRADALNMAGGSLLVLAQGNASNFYVDTAPVVYSGTNIVKNVYAEKSIGGRLLPSWVAYDAASGGRVYEAVVAERALNIAGADEFVRVTDATNLGLAANRTVGGLNVDTTQNMTGSILTVSSGQVLLWKDNTITMGLNFGTQQGVITNAGTNTINSISGSNGLLKNGQGILVLSGYSNYTGMTQVAQGSLTVTEYGRIGDVSVASGARLNLYDTVHGAAKIVSNQGTVDLGRNYTNTTYLSNSFGGVINVHAALSNQGIIDGGGGGGSINVGYNGSLSNQGTIEGLVNVDSDGHLTNAGGATIRYVNHSSINAFTNAGIVNGMYNSGTVFNYGTVRQLSNEGIFTNYGTLVLDGASLNGTVTNTATATLNAGSYATGGVYKQTAGTTTINGELHSAVLLEGGILKGRGGIFGDLTVSNGAQVNPGNSPGRLVVNGNVTLNVGSVLNLEVTYLNGVLAYDQLIVNGSLVKNGDINFDLGTGVIFDGNSFSSHGQTVAMANIFSLNLLSGLEGKSFSVTDAGGSTQYGFTAENLAPVPEPETYAMMLAGLGLVGWSVRRRKAEAMQ